jgi:hypothetical protein
MAVSFSQGSFSGFGITVPYGPNSTPESIASHLAALITKQYASSGLTAQAYGANILYKGNATLGAANFTSSGSSSDSSFAADPAPASCAPVSINLRLVPLVSRDEGLPSDANPETTILHNVWRLVTLDGKVPLYAVPNGLTQLKDTISEHVAIQRKGTVPDGQGGYTSSSPDTNIFEDGIGCLAAGLCTTNPPTPPYWQKFTITEVSGPSPNLTQGVMIRIPGQGDRLVMTIHEHGTAAPTMNDDTGPMPQFSLNPYHDPNPYPRYSSQ